MSILHVEPDPEASGTQAALERAGYSPTCRGSVRDAEDALAALESVEAVVTEYELPDGTGLELVDQVREAAPDAVCVLYTETPLERIDTAEVDGLIVEYVNRTAPDAAEQLVGLLEFSIGARTQTAYPLPADEAGRLAALEEYVDDPEALDASFGRLTEIATELFDVESATIGFLEADEERFLACHGTDIDRLDREKTVCTYTIVEGDDVMIVQDTQDDPRFSDNEALISADIRFYAGAPLRTGAGDALGVFCLFDPDPRSFAPDQRRLLSSLADEAMELLELRLRLRKARDGGDDE